MGHVNMRYAAVRFLMVNLAAVLVVTTNLTAQTDTIRLDLGNSLSVFPWNNLTQASNGMMEGLVTVVGWVSSVNVAVTDPFTGINGSGTTMADPSLGIPATASGDSFFGNTVEFGGSTQPTAALRWSGLDTSAVHTFTLFASRMGVADHRQTKYILHGMTVDSAFLEVANNTDSVVSMSARPRPDGTMDLLLAPGPLNDNANGFYYLGAVTLVLPADTSLAPELDLVRPAGGEFWQAGKLVRIEWISTVPDVTLVDYSTDNGSTWVPIDTVAPGLGRLDWTVPPTPTTNARVRVRSGLLTDQSTSGFEISTDNSECRIVVIGSSTAAGSGVSTPDSAWVNRYRKSLHGRDTRMVVTNLAKGGFTTWHLIPDGAVVPPGIPFAIDTARNITHALSLDPSGVIINLPSNDAASNFGVPEQLANFALMAEAASLAGVPVYICTTQPRNFTDPVKRQIQLDLRDSIFQIYGDRAIDFWTGLADSIGYISTEFNSGDGVHMNDAAHRILVARVVDHQVDTLCTGPMTAFHNPDRGSLFDVAWYPNPFTSDLNLRINLPWAADMEITFYDSLGRFLDRKEIAGLAAGNHRLSVQPALPDTGRPSTFLARIELRDYRGHRVTRAFALQRL